MPDILTYIATFAADFATALPAKASDPIAWVACMGGLLLGGASAWWRPGSWAWAVAFAALVVVVRMLADAYSSPVSRGDNAALAFILVAGILAGTLLGWLSRRRSA
jgi:hypothetical protein